MSNNSQKVEHKITGQFRYALLHSYSMLGIRQCYRACVQANVGLLLTSPSPSRMPHISVYDNCIRRRGPRIDVWGLDTPIDEYWFWRTPGCCSGTGDGGLIQGRIGCTTVYTRSRISLYMLNQELRGSKNGGSDVVNSVSS
jgi:hypothetical protein